jgi:hypothetical protein
MRIASLLSAALLALALSACGPGRTTFARYPGAPVAFERTAQDPKALELADKVLAAAGGAAPWSTAKQLRWSQSVTHDGKEIVGGEQAWDRWNGRAHGRARREGGDIIVMRSLTDEKDAWVFMENPENKHLRKIEGGSADAIKTATERWQFDTALLFMPWLLEEPGTKLELAGEAQSDDGKPQQVLKVTFDSKDANRAGTTYFVVVDTATNMIARIEIQKAGKAENERLGYSLSGWLEAGGMKYPGSVQNLGFQSEVVTFKDLTISEPEDIYFVPPPMT